MLRRPGEFQHEGVSWLGDSSGVVTSGGRHDTWDTDFATDLYAVPLAEDGEPRRITGGDGIYGHATVSPDGTQVAFTGIVDPMTWIHLNSVEAVNIPTLSQGS